MTRAGSILLGALLLCIPGVDAQQPRDNRRPSRTGTATLGGIVFADDDQAQPLRRARVIIDGSELELARTAITNDEGEFVFYRLPAGRYTLTASKGGHPSLAFGAPRPGRPGTPITLRGAEVRQLELKLPRGAVITGMLRDPQGEPAAAVPVGILSRRFSPATGEQRLRTVPNTNTVTDDRGVYRIFGLAAGAYLVTALPRFPGATVPGEITAISREEVQRALAEVQESRFAERPGMPAPSRGRAPPPAPRAGLAFAPTYYPGTTLESRAAIVELSAGEVRSGVDFDLDYVSTATVEGFVTVPPGMRAQLTLTNADPASPYQLTTTAGAGPDGRFTFRRVQPGHYAIHARAFPSSVRSAASPAESTFWAQTEIVVSGEDIEGVTLALQPALTLSGEITFDTRDGGPQKKHSRSAEESQKKGSGNTATQEPQQRAAPTLEGFRLPLRLVSRGTTSAPFPSVLVDGSSVRLHGVVPGPYRFAALPQGIRTRVGRWWLKSVLLDGREVLDEELVIPPTREHIAVTFSDQASELSGVVTDDLGPVTDAYAVVFAEDRKSWFLHSRRVAAVRLNSEGSYVVWNLPAGNYLVAVSSELENNEWFDPEVLEAFRASATRVQISGDQTKTQDVFVGQRKP